MCFCIISVTQYHNCSLLSTRRLKNKIELIITYICSGEMFGQYPIVSLEVIVNLTLPIFWTDTLSKCNTLATVVLIKLTGMVVTVESAVFILKFLAPLTKGHKQINGITDFCVIVHQPLLQITTPPSLPWQLLNLGTGCMVTHCGYIYTDNTFLCSKAVSNTWLNEWPITGG